MAQVGFTRGHARGRHPVRLSLVITTARPVPHVDWVMDGLAGQLMAADRLELVIVDGLGRSLADLGVRALPQVWRSVVTRPKPCAWQGAQRVTARDYWAASNARNTGLVLCTEPCVAFLDDCCQLGDGWLDAVRTWATVGAGVVLAGAYDKLDVPVRILDHRLAQYPAGRRDCGGGWLYGGNFACSLMRLLDVNGFEEGLDGFVGGEDVVLGHMLARRGIQVDFSAAMRVQKLRSASVHHWLGVADRGMSHAKRVAIALARFGQRTRTEFTPDLRQLRARYQAGNGFPDVDRTADPRDWLDGDSLVGL